MHDFSAVKITLKARCNQQMSNQDILSSYFILVFCTLMFEMRLKMLNVVTMDSILCSGAER